MLKEEIQKEVIANLKAKKELHVRVLRFILSEINYEEIKKQKALTGEEIVALLKKEIKKRKEAIELFKKGKRDDLVKEEEAQITIIKKYVPEGLPLEELKKIVDETISSSEVSHVGQVIGLVIRKVNGQADGETIAKLVQEKLGQSS